MQFVQGQPQSITGNALILSGLNAVEFELVDRHERALLKLDIATLANEESAFGAELTAQTAGLPRRRDFHREADGPISLEERTEVAELWKAEWARAANARESFIAGVQRMKLRLLRTLAHDRPDARQQWGNASMTPLDREALDDACSWRVGHNSFRKNGPKCPLWVDSVAKVVEIGDSVP